MCETCSSMHGAKEHKCLQVCTHVCEMHGSMIFYVGRSSGRYMCFLA